MSFYINKELRDWVTIVGNKLPVAEYRIYLELLFEYVCEGHGGFLTTAQEIYDRLELNRHTVSGNLKRLKDKRWIWYQYTFNKNLVIQWVRTKLDEEVPQFPVPGVVIVSPTGRHYTVPYGKFAYFERRYKLPRQFIQGLMRREGSDRQGKNKLWRIDREITF